jgi:hypothetical protein
VRHRIFTDFALVFTTYTWAAIPNIVLTSTRSTTMKYLKGVFAVKWAIGTLLSFVILFVCTSFQRKEEWTPLLDKKLSKWEVYLSYRHQLGYKGEMPKDENGQEIQPIGYNKPNNVFTMIQENGEPVLKVSGEIYGCVFTKQEFENYHLKLKVKWGNKKWVPRMNEDMDSGILYHSQGTCGVDYWRSWMLSQELQIIEKSIGDYWSIASSRIDIPAQKAESLPGFIYDPKGTVTSLGSGTGNGNFCQAKANYEKPNGEWNEVELITYGDKSLHIVNGQVVMTLSNSRYMDGEVSKPLVKGKIQLQSEAAEVYFKDVQIRNITGIPKQYASYFN